MIMYDLIDRSALLERIKSVYCGNCNSDNGDKCRFCEYDVIITLIEGQTTVEKTLSELRRENIQLRAERDATISENNRLKMEVNNYRISLETFGEENYALSAELKMLRAERDELIENIVCKCNNCKHYDGPVNAEPCNSCFVRKPVCTHSKWEWRGNKTND